MPQPEGLLDRLSAAAKPGEPWPLLVLAALEGPVTPESALVRRLSVVANPHNWI